MGKKKTKAGADKKAARKAAEAKKQAKINLIKQAAGLADPLAALPAPFRAYNRNGMNVELEVKRTAELEESDLAAVEAILEGNMRTFFDDWEDTTKVKQRDLRHADTRLLIARVAKDGEAACASPAVSPVKASPTSSKTPAGPGPEPETAAPKAGDIAAFVQYRYEIEETVPVLYIYELQVRSAPWSRRKGMGKFLMMMSEMLAKNAKMHGIMLTVNHNNKPANAFYRSCKYSVDEISPVKVNPMADEDDYDYEIMSKIWDAEGRATLAAAGEEARDYWNADHEGRVY